MALIRIEERGRDHQSTQAVVSFNHGPQYPVTVTDPFTEQQERDLSWYFGEHLRLPFLESERAKQAAASIKPYGEALFQQIFRANPDVYAAYKEHAKAGLEKLHFEIAGSPAFHALHWEALKDPGVPHPFALDAILVRKNLTPIPFEATLATAPVLRVLVVTARPDGKRDVGYRTISRPLVETLRQANLRVQIDLLRPGTYDILEQTLRAATDQHGKGYYHVIHMQAGIQVVLAMGYSVTVSAASRLMQDFYQQLFSGSDFPAALRSARLALAGHKARQAAFQMSIDLEDWLLPVLCQNDVVRLSTRELTPEEDRQFHEQQAALSRATDRLWLLMNAPGIASRSSKPSPNSSWAKRATNASTSIYLQKPSRRN